LIQALKIHEKYLWGHDMIADQMVRPWVMVWVCWLASPWLIAAANDGTRLEVVSLTKTEITNGSPSWVFQNSNINSAREGTSSQDLKPTLALTSATNAEFIPKLRGGIGTRGVQSPVQLIVLGVAQDAGFPQAGCQKPCCQAAWENPDLRRMVSCVAVVDRTTGGRWMFDATPDFPEQLRLLEKRFGIADDLRQKNGVGLSGIFLTHAHIGHYTGLMHLGREAIGAQRVETYCMPRMESFLRNNGPWSQLVKLENLKLKELKTGIEIKVGAIQVTPFLVPHRDEYSETVGFLISGPNRRVMFLPDIDKWSRWDQSIEAMIKRVDVAYLDGTFFANGEIPGRDMSQIPHPFIRETINRFAPLDEMERKKVRFIHLNHTNPALQAKNPSAEQIEKAGMRIAVEGEVIDL
jgi:pyrroloquinoline quinone biosynthesis protein B